MSHKRLEQLRLTERSSDPANPSEGESVIWQSDGTGTGEDGDILMKITSAASTATLGISPKTRSKSTVYSGSDITWNGTTVVNLRSLSLEAGTWLLIGQTSFTHATTGGVNYIWMATSASSVLDADRVSGSQASFSTASGRHWYKFMGVVSPSSTTTYYLNCKLNGSGTSVCIDISIGTGIGNPDQAPAIYAVRLD